MMKKEQTDYGAPYGYRAKVGLIVVGPNLNPTPEITRMLPPYVQIRETRIHMDPDVTVEEVSKLKERLPDAAGLITEGMCSEVLGDNSAIAFACTAGSLVGGPGWDETEIEAMESASRGIPATTTATACGAAMKELDFDKIVIAGPYIDEVNERFEEFYGETEFEVLNIEGLGIQDLYEMGATKPSRAYQIAMEADVPEADGIFIACTNFRCSDVIEEIEEDAGKPVVTANQATAWQLMQMLDIDEPVEGYGQLLKKVPRSG